MSTPARASTTSASSNYIGAACVGKPPAQPLSSWRTEHRAPSASVFRQRGLPAPVSTVVGPGRAKRPPRQLRPGKRPPLRRDGWGVRPWPSAARDGRGVRPGVFGVVEGTVGERGPVEGREQVGKGSERRKNGERTEGCRAGVGPFVRFGRKMLRKGNFYSDVDPFGVFFRGSFWFFRRIDYICRFASAENQIRAAL